MQIKKDRLDVIRALEKIQTQGGIKAQSIQLNLCPPGPSNKNDSGRWGKFIERMVGITPNDSSPDYIDCELKTFAKESSSHITLMSFDPADLELSFIQTKLFNKISKIVFAEHRQRFDEDERVISGIFSLDSTHSEIFQTMVDDFNKIKAQKGESIGLDTVYLIVDSSSKDKPVWRLRNSSISKLWGVDSLKQNPLFA